MAYILCLETATSICSVALSRDGVVLFLKESSIKNFHSSLITLFVKEVVQKTGIKLQEIDAIAVSKGPGSYTGLRIGASTAKGLCFALDKPLLAINTLKAMAFGMAEKIKAEYFPNDRNMLLCPMIDARRMEVYDALYTFDNIEIRGIQAEIIREDSFNEYFKENNILFFGDNVIKCEPVLRYRRNAVFITDFTPSASHMAQLAKTSYDDKKFEDVAYFEPFYLKDFIAGKPNVKGLK
jgi:tRNA threonylcarbamoyladenosine biosynthesis protein TsaB